MKYILFMLLQRILLGLLTLFAISIIIFLAVQMLPGDAAQAILGQAGTPETVAALRTQLGLDMPAHIRYLHWLGNIFQGDFGTSIGNGREISEVLGTRFYNTLFLATFAACIAVPLALTLGILAALYRNTLYDRSCQRGDTFVDFYTGIFRRIHFVAACLCQSRVAAKLVECQGGYYFFRTN